MPIPDALAAPNQRRSLGYVTLIGGGLGLLLAPIMVIIKYATGWAVIPEPSWVGIAHSALGGLFRFATPPELWMGYGSGYTIALVLMTIGFAGLFTRIRAPDGRPLTKGVWVVLVGFALVIPGDAIHTWTWHQHGLTTPTPGTNPVANTAYALHMLGLNAVMLGSVTIGASALRRRFLARWLAWSFLLVLPAAILASVTLLPTTPSGALWWYSATMAACGLMVATGRGHRLTMTPGPFGPGSPPTLEGGRG